MASPPIEQPHESEAVVVNSPPPVRFRRWLAGWIAWAVIMIMVGLIAAPHLMAPRDSDHDPSIIMFEIQAKYLVGASNTMTMGDEAQLDQIKLAFGTGSLRQRLIGIGLMSELVGAQHAAHTLFKLEETAEFKLLDNHDQEATAARLLAKILEVRVEKKSIESSLTADELAECRTALSKRLGWVGRLVLLPPETEDQAARSVMVGQARRTCFVIVGVFGMGILAMVCGFILQLVFWGFAASGKLASGIGPLRGQHWVYAETFAVWMVLFIGLSFLISKLPLRPSLGWMLIPQIGGLAAIGWPVLRGQKWADVRYDVGLRLGPQGWTAPFVGIGTYLAALPAVGVAMIFTVLTMAVARQFAAPGEVVTPPIHPIVEPILRGGWTMRLQLLFIAVFAAVPEEIMFRGFLYRSLREVEKTVGFHCGVVFALLVSSFIFAVIHPQGLYGIPILMTLAIVFGIVREWRGSLVPCMIAHAFVNAGTTTILFLIAD